LGIYRVEVGLAEVTADALNVVRGHLQTAESWRRFPYPDTRGKTTIGWGRNLTDDGITVDEGALLFEHDLACAVTAVAVAFPWTATLDDVRLGVVIELEFNIGLAGEEKFTTMLACLEAGHYPAAAAALLNSKLVTEEHTRAEQWAAELSSGIAA
jgi:lysozyme